MFFYANVRRGLGRASASDFGAFAPECRLILDGLFIHCSVFVTRSGP